MWLFLRPEILVRRLDFLFLLVGRRFLQQLGDGGERRRTDVVEGGELVGKGFERIEGSAEALDGQDYS